MIDYVGHLSKAVHPSPRLLLSKRARANVYRRAGDALQRQMKRYGPSVAEEEIAAELARFHRAAAQVERAVQEAERPAE